MLIEIANGLRETLHGKDMTRVLKAIFLSVAATVCAEAAADDADCVEDTRRYAAEICAALRAENLPLELSMLPVSESCGKPDSVSSNGAAGIWQLMPFISRRYGLNPADRSDVGKSSAAAAKYLKSLYDRFGDVLWTVAAYNAGGHNLKRATVFKRGMNIRAAKAMPAAYALAMHVKRLNENFGNLCETNEGQTNEGQTNE